MKPRPAAFVLVLAGCSAALASDPPPAAPAFGFDAPLLVVDRFSDAAGTFLRRSARPDLPAPNAPIKLDAPPFVQEVAAPGGRKGECYLLDRRPAEPARLYVFYDKVGNYILTQFPVVDVAPGDPGYSDLWDVWKVTVPDSFKPDNSVRDMETVRKLLRDPDSGFVTERSGALVNGPIVPEGSTAQRKAEKRDGAATLRYLWYRGKRAPYLYFEEKLRLTGEGAPTSKATVAKDALPAAGTPLDVDTLPGDPGYSPLRVLMDAKGRASPGAPLNCPVVGP